MFCNGQCLADNSHSMLSLVWIKLHQLILLVSLNKECWYTKYYIEYKTKNVTQYFMDTFLGCSLALAALCESVLVKVVFRCISTKHMQLGTRVIKSKIKK